MRNAMNCCHPMLLVALLALAAFGQPPESRPEAPATTDAEAIAVLKRAAAVQVPGGSAPQIVDFQADFQVTFYDQPEGGGTPVARSAQVIEFWQKQARKTRYLRVLSEEGGKRTLLGWNGRQPWMQDGKGPVVDLNDRNFQKDREQLTDEMRRVEEMVRYLFVEHLISEGALFTFRERGMKLKRESGEVVVDEVLRRVEGEESISVLVSTEGHQVVGVRVNPGTEQEDLLLFDYHEMLERTEEDGSVTRFLIPTRVDYYYAGRHEFSASAKRASRIKFNSGLKPALFDPPRR